MNPRMTLYMANGSRIVAELLPEAAPNTVSSLIYAASHGWMDHHAIERIVPGNWVDLSYTAFGHKEAQYLIPNEFDLNPEIVPLDSHPGCVCMGGYGAAGLAGCEIFFPLRDCPEHKGVYPVIGRVLEGMEEIRRLEQVPTRRVVLPYTEMEVNEPLEPQIIDRVELELFGQVYPEPVRMARQDLPPNWTGDRGQTLAEIAGPGRTHCVLELEDEVRSLRIAADTDRYTVLDEETATLDCLLSADAAAIIGGGLEEPDEDEPIRVIRARWEDEDVTIYIPESW